MDILINTDYENKNQYGKPGSYVLALIGGPKFYTSILDYTYPGWDNLVADQWTLNYNWKSLKFAEGFSYSFLKEYFSHRDRYLDLNRYFDCVWFANGINNTDPNIHNYRGEFIYQGKFPKGWYLQNNYKDTIKLNQEYELNWTPNIVAFNDGERDIHFGTMITLGDNNDFPVVFSKMGGRNGDLAISSLEHIQNGYPYQDIKLFSPF